MGLFQTMLLVFASVTVGGRQLNRTSFSSLAAISLTLKKKKIMTRRQFSTLWACMSFKRLFFFKTSLKALWFSSVQSLSRVRLFGTSQIAARQASLSITNSRSSLKLTSIEPVMPTSHLILCHPLLLLPPSGGGVFSQHQSLFQ